MSTNSHTLNFNNTETLSLKTMMRIVVSLSIPAIIAQMTTVIMQYIDAAMVGSLGANASASIGLVSTTTWLLSGFCAALATGFSVQIAQFIGAGRSHDARSVFRQSLIISVAFGMLLASVGMSISFHLPGWLGGERAILSDASSYFLIFAVSLPASQLRQTTSSALQCSGDMKTPSVLNIIMCFLDVVFNFFLIYPTRNISFFGTEITVFGAGLGVTGAAISTAAADYVTAILMLGVTALKSGTLAFRHGGSWHIRKNCIKTALKISFPAAFEHVIMCSAYICSTTIVAPLGTVAVAANSLAVTAESFCYMPGYGVGRAATTLIGQSLGAKQPSLAKRFASTAIFLGVAIMTVTAVLMYAIAPWIFSILTSSPKVHSLGTQMLRIVAFAEPLYAASIVCIGVLRGAGDTVGPAILNLVSMWGVRIALCFIIVPYLGLHGVWIAMSVELCVRGILMLVRVKRGKWLGKQIIV